MKKFLLLRHLIIPLFLIRAFMEWHPLWIWLYLPVGVSWAVFWYTQAFNPGWLVVYGGALLNKICMIANGGYMPVGGGLITETQGRHTPLRPDHVLVGLADIHGGASFGDFAIFSGLALVLLIFIGRRIAKSPKPGCEYLKSAADV